ncbi:MAG: hypothetical protein EHM20_11820 [Alphaproteobacteria bacterium]|nr:MAG: hypothetical protein EHM20_11820 [Alphaproteobacteria bacterium]
MIFYVESFISTLESKIPRLLENEHIFKMINESKDQKDFEKLLGKAIQAQDYLRYYNEEILKQNLSISKLLDEIANVIDKLKVDHQEKRYIINQLGKYSFRINQGTDQTLQLKCFLNSLASFHDN